MKLNIVEHSEYVKFTVGDDFKGFEYPFYAESILKVPFEYSQGDHVKLSFHIRTPNDDLNLEKGSFSSKNPYDGYYVIFNLSYGIAELNNLQTPKSFRHKGFASAILKLIDMTILEYNKNKEQFKKLKDFKKINQITGLLHSCDDNELSQERLILFYRKMGFCPPDKETIYKEY